MTEKTMTKQPVGLTDPKDILHDALMDLAAVPTETMWAVTELISSRVATETEGALVSEALLVWANEARELAARLANTK